MRIRASSCRWLWLIDENIRRYNYQSWNLPCAASDVLDGLATRAELKDLIARRVLAVIKIPRGEGAPHGLCGSTWTVDLTALGIATFWPDRDRPASGADPRGEG